MMIIAIDPAPVKSGFVLADKLKIINIGIHENEKIRFMLKVKQHNLSAFAIELVKSYGMSVGQSIFDTCIETGRFIESYNCDNSVFKYSRKEIVTYICGSSKAKDGNVRQSLIDLYAEHYGLTDKTVIGTKKDPGPLYGVSNDMWSALAVSVYHQKLMEKI